MHALRSSVGLLGALTLAGVPIPAGAQPVGSEFQINTYTTSNQRTVRRGGGGHLAAADASGNFVVVWNSSGQDGSGDGIFGQRYDSEGGAQGSEFRVNSFSTDSQLHPSVAAAADGGFVVVWSSSGQDGSGYGVFGQRYDSGGTALGNEFRVNSFTTNYQRQPTRPLRGSGRRRSLRRRLAELWPGWQLRRDLRPALRQRRHGSGERVPRELQKDLLQAVSIRYLCRERQLRRRMGRYFLKLL
jgi:hypothetical protein